MQKTTGQRIENLSNELGGRFKLTSLIQKRIREYYVTGRAFMPKVDNLDELFELVLSQIQEGQIRLRLPEEAPPTFKALSAQDTEAENAEENAEIPEQSDDLQGAEDNPDEDQAQ